MQSNLAHESQSWEDTSQPHLLRLSQGHLNLLETCHRKFQHIYFDQLNSPANPEQQERQTWGSRFHLLMQQQELGLPIEPLVQEDAQLQRWMTALVAAAPEILTPDPKTFRQAEHCRTLNFQSFLLTVIYDLLIADDNFAYILDWKTYLQPKDRRMLEKDWQTRLYLYVLAETSNYLPEQISMTYWFVQSQGLPPNLKFTYDTAQHEKTKRDLTRLLSQLTGLLQRYQHTGEDFPQIAESTGYCNYCNFAVRCQRMTNSSVLDTKDMLPNLAEIQEVWL